MSDYKRVIELVSLSPINLEELSKLWTIMILQKKR